MKDLSPAAMQELLTALPLLAFALALFVTATLLILGAIFGFLPGVYQDRPNVGVLKKKTLSVLLIGAVVCGGFGFLSMSMAGTHITTTTDIVSKTESAPSYNDQ